MKKLLAVVVSLVLVCGMALPAWAEGAVKDETVYILAAPDGGARKIIVSDWLSNPDEAEELTDETNLSDVENVKGKQPFANGVWQAQGQDIYYQGQGTEELPAQVKITYMLDGEEIAPEALAGKDGHVVIRFDYAVTQTATMVVDEQQRSMAVPFAFITAALLENDVFTHVETTNACLVNDGDRTIVVGAALPGVKETLDIDTDGFTLPEYVEIEADVKAFALPVTVTVGTNELFAALDESKLNNTEDLKTAMNDLTDGMTQLLDGSSQLYDGLTTLDTGATQLASGVNELSDGLTTLVANNETLVAGSRQVFETLLAAANQQLTAAGAQVPELTVETYAETLTALIAAMSEDGIAQQAREQVEQAVRAQEEQVRAGVTQAVQAQVEAQVKDQLGENADKETVKAAVEQQMTTENIQGMIGQNTEEQVQVLIEQNLASEEVQQQIAQGVSQYQATKAALETLKGQLDSYSTFHNGLIAYTDGAAAASAGAAQLKVGVPEFQSGITALKDGALTMKNGLGTFNASGVEKLSSLVNEDLEALLANARGLIQAAKSYQSYGGLAEGMNGTVRFIWRTDAIEK